MLCYTESSLNPYVKHPDKDTIGPCGIKKFWDKELKEHGINMYTTKGNVEAMEYIFNKYLKESNGNLKEALKKYKGSETNFLGYNKVIKLYKSVGGRA